MSIRVQKELLVTKGFLQGNAPIVFYVKDGLLQIQSHLPESTKFLNVKDCKSENIEFSITLSKNEVEQLKVFNRISDLEISLIGSVVDVYAKDLGQLTFQTSGSVHREITLEDFNECRMEVNEKVIYKINKMMKAISKSLLRAIPNMVLYKGSGYFLTDNIVVKYDVSSDFETVISNGILQEVASFSDEKNVLRLKEYKSMFIIDDFFVINKFRISENDKNTIEGIFNKVPKLSIFRYAGKTSFLQLREVAEFLDSDLSYLDISETGIAISSYRINTTTLFGNCEHSTYRVTASGSVIRFIISLLEQDNIQIGAKNSLLYLKSNNITCVIACL